MVRENINELAIVIPAYKIDFFRATLDSLAAQTCKDFTVYVGDDCSPNDFETIIAEYKDKLDIHYTRFEKNVGGINLVDQWNRCVELSQGEPWIWLFSDDDELEDNCVQLLLDEIKNNGEKYDVFHFDTIVIDDESKIVRFSHKYPIVLSGYEYYKKKMMTKIDSFVVENVFSRSSYERNHGFTHFDLAWGSDTASWVMFAGEMGIKTIPGAYVKWRKSEINITPNTSPQVLERKFKALLEFLQWAINTFKTYPQSRAFNFLATTKRFHYYSKGMHVNRISELSEDYLKANFGYMGFKVVILLTKLFKQW